CAKTTAYGVKSGSEEPRDASIKERTTCRQPLSWETQNNRSVFIFYWFLIRLPSHKPFPMAAAAFILPSRGDSCARHSPSASPSASGFWPPRLSLLDNPCRKLNFSSPPPAT